MFGKSRNCSTFVGCLVLFVCVWAERCHLSALECNCLQRLNHRSGLLFLKSRYIFFLYSLVSNSANRCPHQHLDCECMFFYTILLREEANRLCSTFSRSADCSTPAAVLSKDYVDVFFFITLVQRSEDFLQFLQFSP